MKWFIVISLVWLLACFGGYTWIRYGLTEFETAHRPYVVDSGINPDVGSESSFGSTWDAAIDQLRQDEAKAQTTDDMAAALSRWGGRIHSHVAAKHLYDQRRRLILEITIIWAGMTLVPIIGGVITLYRARTLRRSACSPVKEQDAVTIST